MIQSIYALIPLYETRYGSELIEARLLYRVLDNYNPKQQQGPHTYTNKDQKIKQVQQEISELFNRIEQKPTKEEEILILLPWLYVKAPTPKAGIEQLQDKINAYKPDETSTVYNKYPIFLSFLGPVAEQLHREYEYHNKGRETKQLEQLEQLLRNFSDAYKRKTQQQIQERTATLEGILKKQEDKKHQNTKKVNFAKL